MTGRVDVVVVAPDLLHTICWTCTVVSEVHLHISASVQNETGWHHVLLQISGHEQSIEIPSKASGLGSSINGGGLLLLALATCYCNDIFRQAAKRHIEVVRVEVTVRSEFGPEGETASKIEYRAKVVARCVESEIRSLMTYVDRVAEIQTTLRKATSVTLKQIDTVSV
jgi:organic hydroperoxide reductase OsmC/OhrA